MEDPDGVKQREREAKAKRRKKNPEKVRKEEKERKAKYRSNDKQNYKKEVRFAAVFPCVCCHTWKFRDQVVKFNPEAIGKAAKAAHDKQQVKLNNKLFKMKM